MAFLARSVAFCIGLGVAGVALFMLAFRFPHAWMPLFLGAFMALLVGSLSWTPKGYFLTMYQSTWLAGTFALWMLSSAVRLPIMQVRSHYALLVFAAVGLLTTMVLATELRSKAKRVGFLLLAILLVGLAVSYLSGPPGRLDIIARILERLGVTSATAPLIVRKLGHFTLYGILASLSAKASLAAGNRKVDAVAFALAVVLAVAGFDELRQSTHPQRVGSPVDLLIDLFGAVVFLCFTKATKGVRS